MNTYSNAPTINYKALAYTIGIHLVLLLLLALWKYKTPVFVTSPPDMGMEVNLGTDENGFGSEQPMDMEDPANQAANSVAIPSSAQEETQKPVEETDEADAPDVSKPVKPIATPRNNTTTPRVATTPATRNNTSTNTTRPTTTNNQQKPKFVYTGSNGNGGNGANQNANGGNEGNTFGNGDRGVPNGTPGANNYTGSPVNGTGGISHSLDRRSIIAFPPKEAEFREGGKVVIRITVNREGEIVNKQVLSSTNAELRSLALKKLSTVKFNKSEQAPAEQFGNITFVFKARS